MKKNERGCANKNVNANSEPRKKRGDPNKSEEKTEKKLRGEEKGKGRKADTRRESRGRWFQG